MQSLSHDIHITLRGPATLFFERVQHIHGFDELRDLHDPVLHGGVNAYLIDVRSDGRHHLPVVRLQPLLNSSELEAREPSRICGKGPDVIAARSKPHQRPIAHHAVCNYPHIGSNRFWRESLHPAIDACAPPSTRYAGVASMRAHSPEGHHGSSRSTPRELPVDVVRRPRDRLREPCRGCTISDIRGTRTGRSTMDVAKAMRDRLTRSWKLPRGEAERSK